MEMAKKHIPHAKNEVLSLEPEIDRALSYIKNNL
jgi:hypothetical protein